MLNRQPWKEVERIVIREGASEPGKVVARLRRFVEMLLQWNITVSNLISKNDEARVVEAHVLPAIEASGWIRSRDLKLWCDLGSGGGFPAIPLALCGVGETWDLIESRRTKTLFLRRAVQDLQLQGIRVLVARIEDLLPAATASAGAGGRVKVQAGGPEAEGWGDEAVGGDAGEPGWGDEHGPSTPASFDEPLPALHPAYDGFTSRATMTLGPTLSYAARIVRPEGCAFLWKGSRLEQEAASEPRWRDSWAEGESRSLTIPHSVVASFVRNSS